jgi:hypothetical protein
MNVKLGAADSQALARAYFKIALGTVAYDQGQEFALSDRYDMARSFIAGRSGFPNPLLLSKKGEPHNRVQVRWQKLDPGTVFMVDIFGFGAVFNIEGEPFLAKIAIFQESRNWHLKHVLEFIGNFFVLVACVIGTDN